VGERFAMTWDDTDRDESAKFFDQIEQNAYDVGVLAGRIQERKEIIDFLEIEASDWLSHDGTCLCRYKGDEILRLVKKIEERK
jgi:hypothetical protein